MQETPLRKAGNSAFRLRLIFSCLRTVVPGTSSNRACGLAQCPCKEKTPAPPKPSKKSSGDSNFLRSRHGGGAPGGECGTVYGKQPLLRGRIRSGWPGGAG